MKSRWKFRENCKKVEVSKFQYFSLDGFWNQINDEKVFFWNYTYLDILVRKFCLKNFVDEDFDFEVYFWKMLENFKLLVRNKKKLWNSFRIEFSIPKNSSTTIFHIRFHFWQNLQIVFLRFIGNSRTVGRHKKDHGQWFFSAKILVLRVLY